jgi:hypothetical protein
VLVRYEPTIVRPPDPRGPRTLWLTADLRKWCLPVDAHPDGRITDRSLAHLLEQLNAFVRGSFMEYGTDIRRLDPIEKDIWEIKSHLVKPQLRMFGWFALPRMFVAIHAAVRDDLEKVSGPKWDRAIATAEDARTEMVGSVLWYDPDPLKYL